MSLLVKALEKASKDREAASAVGSAPTTAAHASAASHNGSGLTLEPLPAPTPGTAPRGSPADARASAPAAAPESSRDSQKAAAFINATRREPGSFATSLRNHPLIAFGSCAALFLLLYGGYVYLQLSNPGMFAKQPPRPVQPIASGPATAPIPPAASDVSKQVPVQGSVGTTPLLPPMPQMPTEKGPTPPPPLIAAIPPSLSAAAPPVPGPAPAASGTTGTPADAQGAGRAASTLQPPPPLPPPRLARESIKVTTAAATPTMNPMLTDAYKAFSSGNTASSQALYSDIVRNDPRNVEAILGLAAVANQTGESEQASRYYMRALELDPQNASAQAGLIGVGSKADPSAAETRLKLLISREPSAYLFFVLGNVYTDQNRWPDAQQAYFRAYQSQPDNPDYAFNLAVGLEHIGQMPAALNYYRRAAELAATGSRANFNLPATQARIAKLAKALE